MQLHTDIVNASTSEDYAVDERGISSIWSYVSSMGRRRTNPRIINTIPRMASGAAVTEGINALLMPLARSEGSGVVGDVAIVSNDDIIPKTDEITQTTARRSVTAPAQIIQRVARVRGAAFDASPAWYGFGFAVFNVIYRIAVATERWRSMARGTQPRDHPRRYPRVHCIVWLGGTKAEHSIYQRSEIGSSYQRK